jgi:DNA-binding transcriptional LysR family regulator
MGQPQLSRALRRLEEQVGARLLARTSREVRLTEAGAALLAQARRLLAIATAAPLAAREAARGESGALALGFSGSAAYAFLPGVVEGFRRLRPGVRLELREMSAESQVLALRDRRLDFCLMRGDGVPPGLAGARVFAEPYVAALPRAHPAAATAGLRLAALADSDFVVFPPDRGSGFHRAVFALCAEAGFTPRIVQAVAPMQALIGLVGAGVGVAIVPASARKLRFAGVTFRRLAGVGRASEVWAVWDRARLTPTARAFAAHLGVAP